MTRFCNLDRCGSRFINLDHVQTIDLTWDDTRGKNCITVTYTNGKHETLYSDLRPELEELTAPVVPALPGFERLTFGFYDELKPPTVADVLAFYNRDPIVAWRITEGGPEPVSLDEYNTPAGLVAILRPDGAVVMLDDETFENLNKWAEHALKQLLFWRENKKKKIEEKKLAATTKD